MSTVAPNGQIRFLTQVPIDSNYENSLDFLSEVEQRSYFLGLQPVHTMIGATRVRDGVISVNMVADNLLHANYLMFQNMNFNNKWFYAFITDIEYVNNNMSYVYYQIDDIQTWMFDVQLKECFVEREHTVTDGMFEHLVDEGIGTSEYITNTSGDKTYSDYVAVLYTGTGNGFTVSGTHAPVQITNGILKGLSGYVFELQDNNGNWLELRQGYNDPSDPTEHDSIINSGNGLEKLNLYVYDLTNAQQKDSIVGIVIVPKHFIGTMSNITITQKNAVSDNLGFTNYTITTPLNGNYVPTNNKLYNSPYCLIDIIMSDGQTIHLQPEFLQQGNNLVNILSNMSPSPSILAIPKNYMGNEYAWEKAINYDAFPQGAVSVDGYSAWVASGGLKQLKNSNYRAIAGDVVQGVSSVATQNAVGTAGSVISLVYQVEEFSRKMDVAKKLPAELIGQSDATPVMANKMFSIGYRMCSLKRDVLESLDGYFNMFGYKVNKVKTPSRRNRPHYTYIKTKGCKVNGGAPADAIDRIQAIYDNGIRFWVNPDEVGNYTGVDNRPA